jgi:NarL family two-component system response regulator LiaR
MRKTILLYGVAEYRFFVHDLSLEVYLGTVAVLFTGLGIWAGQRLTRKKVIVANPEFKLSEPGLQRLGISKCEYEVLELIAQDLSNHEMEQAARSLLLCG